MRRKLNRDAKRELRAADLVLFLRRYGRKKRPSGDPNDRNYDREQERALKRMDPELVDTLLLSDDDQT